MSTSSGKNTPCYVLQQIQRFDGQTKLEQISVHTDIQFAIDKLITIIMNYIDAVLSSDQYISIHDTFRNYTKNRNVNVGINGIDKHIKQYIHEQINERANLNSEQEEILSNFQFMSDEEDKIPSPMDILIPNNIEMRVGNESLNNIYEITHGEFTLSLMKSYLE